MIITINKREMPIFLFFSIITLSGSKYLYDIGISHIFEYMAYSLYFISLFYLLKNDVKKHNNTHIVWFILATLIISIGVLVQDLSLTRKFTVLFTVSVFTSAVFLCDDYFDSFRKIRLASKAILLGSIAAFFIALITKYSVLELNTVNIFGSSYGFTGGIKYKNYFGANMVSVFVGFYLYNKYVEKSFFDRIIMIICAFFVFLSNSRGAIFMLLAFLVFQNYKVLGSIVRYQRIFVVLVVSLLMIPIVIYGYNHYLINISTYSQRIRGLTNYLNTYGGQTRDLLFGVSDMLYDKNGGFVYQFRNLFGWNGTLEISWIMLLVRNGLFGIIGYFVMFLYCILRVVVVEEIEIKSAAIALLISILMSSLVEGYITSVHTPVGVYFILGISGICGSAEYFAKEKIMGKNVISYDL